MLHFSITPWQICYNFLCQEQQFFLVHIFHILTFLIFMYTYIAELNIHKENPGLLFHSSNWWRSIGNRSQTSTFQEGDRKCRESWSTPITKWSEKIWSSDEAGWRGPTASLSSLEPSGGATVVVSWHKEPHCQCRATPLCHTPPSEPPSSCTGTPPHTWCKTRSAAPGHCSLANSTSDATQVKIGSPDDLVLSPAKRSERNSTCLLTQLSW